MSFIRARQHAITALFPHQANRKYIIPNRGILLVKSVSAITTATVMTVKFTASVITKPGNTDGLTVTVNAIGGTVTDVQPVAGAPDQLAITFTPAALSTQAVVVLYTPPGEIKEALSLKPLELWTETAVFP